MYNVASTEIRSLTLNTNNLVDSLRQTVSFVQLRRKFETVSVSIYIEVKRGSYDLAAGLGLWQQTVPEKPGGKIYINYGYYKEQWNCRYNPRRQNGEFSLQPFESNMRLEQIF